MTVRRLTASPKWLPTTNCQLNLSTKNVNHIKLDLAKFCHCAHSRCIAAML